MSESYKQKGAYWYNSSVIDFIQSLSEMYSACAGLILFFQALEDKYDSLRDKLLMDLLMRQLGDKAWNDMSEKERQRRLMELKRLERDLRRRGEWDELSRLLGENAEDLAKLKGLMGDARDDYLRKLRERMAARERGEPGAEGEDIAEEEEMAAKKVSAADLLKDLDDRMKAEREALLARLRGKMGRSGVLRRRYSMTMKMKMTV